MKRRIFILFLIIVLNSTYVLFAQEGNWNSKDFWHINNDGASEILLEEKDEKEKSYLSLAYYLKKQYGWAEIIMQGTVLFNADRPLVFNIKSQAPDNFEIKFIDTDGSVFGKKISLHKRFDEWTPIVIYLRNCDYWWGGDETFGDLHAIAFAISGHGRGTVLLADIGFGEEGMKTMFKSGGPQLDPDRELSGIGFRQRRHEALVPEDPLVLEYLKKIQDTASPEQWLVSSQEDQFAQTFNNAIVAMAFILKGERERAERILDFYARRADQANTDPTVQNFFLNGEVRGFYQNTLLRAAGGRAPYHSPVKGDRWTGDMAWLLIAYKYYEKEYGSAKYATITTLLRDLLIGFFKEDPEGGGYVQHGWRKDDSKLHEGHGHPEINIDCYAAFRLCGENRYAAKIKTWLDRTLGKKNNLWLDQYTWRVLTFGKEYEEILDIPEYDLRYRRIMEVGGVPVMGFYHAPEAEIENIWLDGTGHIACGYFTVGNELRGNFYANQYDPYLIERVIGGKKTKALPYTANRSGTYDWVNTRKGFISVAAWYIFAKNKFNPMTLEKH